MDSERAILALAALAQPTRLDAFRVLVAAGPAGLAAGDLARRLAVPANTLSAHLAVLARAGLVRGERHSRSVLYRAVLGELQALMRFLAEDCCGGRPQQCAELLFAPLMPTRRESAMTDAAPERIYNVLFLCTGNSARSLIAESVLTKDGAGRFRAFSAGSQPKGAPHPKALEVLAYAGYPTTGLRSKSWNEFAEPGAPVMDFVFTVCDAAAGEACPLWPGQPMTAHWGIEDPAAVGGPDIVVERAFVTALRYLKNRIAAFSALPITSLDQLTLGARLRDIGRMEGATSSRPEVI